MQLPETIEIEGIKVLTTKQIAEAYGVKPDIIGYNFRYNKERYVEGKHYIMLEGQVLREFKATNVEIQRSLPKISKLYLWTEKGALLHAKSLNTDKAWQVYDFLVDFYFRVKANEPEIQEKKEHEKRVSKKIDISSETGILKAIQKIRRDITCMDVLLEKCENEIWESKYIDTKFEAMDMVRMIAEDCNKLAQLQPKVIQEVNW
ncbi:MAG: ORF6N domain-containing protein [Lachnospiraceae bacterium]|nr:ORF6N domain-containing protein [Lachnospiraceae bacterium]